VGVFIFKGNEKDEGKDYEEGIPSKIVSVRVWLEDGENSNISLLIERFIFWRHYLLQVHCCGPLARSGGRGVATDIRIQESC
jgi:hypothetical protein